MVIADDIILAVLDRMTKRTGILGCVASGGAVDSQPNEGGPFKNLVGFSQFQSFRYAAADHFRINALGEVGQSIVAELAGQPEIFEVSEVCQPFQAVGTHQPENPAQQQ